tara:strand:+ start:68 stop:253 length:186 start_codon:yes stop_codon:yes gene_type:complete
MGCKWDRAVAKSRLIGRAFAVRGLHLVDKQTETSDALGFSGFIGAIDRSPDQIILSDRARA